MPISGCPVPEEPYGRNGGVACDTNSGPCACGAWHQKDTPLFLEELRKRAPELQLEALYEESHNHWVLIVNGKQHQVQWSTEAEEAVRKYHGLNIMEEIVKGLVEDLRVQLKKSNGLVHKYQLYKADGSPVSPGSEYFVLRLDRNAEPNHRKACLAALNTYCSIIEQHLPELARDLRQKYLSNPDNV